MKVGDRIGSGTFGCLIIIDMGRDSCGEWFAYISESMASCYQLHLDVLEIWAW